MFYLQDVPVIAVYFSPAILTDDDSINLLSLMCCLQASLGPQSVANGGPPQFSQMRDPQRRLAIQQTYHRLKERQKKLSMLRRGLSVIDADTDMDISDIASLHSEATNFSDGRSLVSAMSVRQGGWSVGQGGWSVGQGGWSVGQGG